MQVHGTFTEIGPVDSDQLAFVAVDAVELQVFEAEAAADAAEELLAAAPVHEPAARILLAAVSLHLHVAAHPCLPRLQAQQVGTPQPAVHSLADATGQAELRGLPCLLLHLLYPWVHRA